MNNHKTKRGVAAGRSTVLDNIVAGALAGLVGAVAVAVAAMLYTGITTPEEGWLPMKNVAATWMGVDAMIGGGGTIALGLATHFGTSMGWGVALALLLGRTRNPALIFLASLVWGAGVVYVVMTWGFLPWLNPVMYARAVGVQAGWWWWVIHLIFGAFLGITLTPLLARRRTA